MVHGGGARVDGGGYGYGYVGSVRGSRGGGGAQVGGDEADVYRSCKHACMNCRFASFIVYEMIEDRRYVYRQYQFADR